MPSAITAHALWELSTINVTIKGQQDRTPGDVIVVANESIRHERSKPHMCEFSNGYLLNASFDLTVEQAESLANQLFNAAQDMRQLDKEYQEYSQNQKEKSK